jgi:hypothetical protein
MPSISSLGAIRSLEAKASQVQADSKVSANKLIADLQKRRDDFQATVKKILQNLVQQNDQPSSHSASRATVFGEPNKIKELR